MNKPDGRLRHRANSRRWAWSCALMAMFAATLQQAQAAPAVDRLSSFLHSQWRSEDGAPADIRTMAQGVDGWLWIATTAGLYRFDGVRFERMSGALGHARIHELYAAPTGDLYIALRADGMTILHADGSVEDMPGSDGPTIGTISSMAMDKDGTLWAIGSAVYVWRAQRWQVVDADPVWQSSNLRSLVLDETGQAWAAHDGGVKRFDPAKKMFTQVSSIGGSLTLAPDGGVWVLPKEGGRITRLSGGTTTLLRSARFNPSGSRFAGLFDSKGALWKLHCPQPVCIASVDGDRAVLPHDEPAAAQPRLSGNNTRQILEDREGNVWIATQQGLDRFRTARLSRLPVPSTENGMTMASDAEGRVWVANMDDGKLWQIAENGEPLPVAGPPVTMIVADHSGGILIAGRRSIWRQSHGRRTEIPLPLGADGKPVDRQVMALVDDGKVVWAAAPDTSLIGWVDGKWIPSTQFNLTDKLYLLVPGERGALWLARAGGELLHYDNERLLRYDAREAGLITGIFPGKDIVVGGDGGLGILAGKRLRMLHANNPDVLRGISGMVTTPDGDRWFNGAAGVVHVLAKDWQAALALPGAILRYELFDTFDGYPGRALIERALPTAHRGNDHTLWFIGSEGVVSLDTATLRRNTIRPVPSIQGVTAERGMAATAPAILAAGTQRFGVSFTAPALRLPERVRFEYRLDGFDSAWQESGFRRVAAYTNVPAGAYRFRVRAFNEDGLKSTEEASLAIRIEPTLLQKRWFQLLCLALLMVGLIALYRYRVQFITRRLIERLQVKTAERERIARALHDSFLQSLFSLFMRVDALTGKFPEDSETHRELDKIRRQTKDVIAEGRDQVSELREGDATGLSTLIEQAIQEVQQLPGAPAVRFEVEGERRGHPGLDAALVPAPVAAEIHEIAREALRNAVKHASATSIEVRLRYGKRSLGLSVVDDGQGIDAAVLAAGGRAGHWGLGGMRERAAHIGARLTIESRAPLGTSVQLLVPARRAYAG